MSTLTITITDKPNTNNCSIVLQLSPNTTQQVADKLIQTIACNAQTLLAQASVKFCSKPLTHKKVCG